VLLAAIFASLCKEYRIFLEVLSLLEAEKTSADEK
jgi:hypothetical protein